MTIIGNICGTCPDVAFVNQVAVVGNAPSITSSTPPSSGSDPTLFPQIVVHTYDNITRVFSSNDGVSWSHFDVDSAGFAIAANVASLPVDPLDEDYYVLTNRMIYNAVDTAYYTADFPGNTNYVNLGKQLIDPNADFDISFEVNPDTITLEQTLFSQYIVSTVGRMNVNLLASGAIRFFIGATPNVDISSTSTIQADKWSSVRVTRDGDTFSLYVNGILEATTTIVGVYVLTYNTFLGTDLNTVDDYNGQIRNVSITSNNITTKYLTEDINLPGATLTAVTSALTNAKKLVPTRLSYCNVDGEWADMTEMVDGQVLHHRDRSTSFIYDNRSEAWSSHVLSNSLLSKHQPQVDTPRVMSLFDDRLGQSYSRTINGKSVLVDLSRNGTIGPIREKYGLTFNGTSEYADATFSPVALVWVSCWFKSSSTAKNQGLIANYLTGTNQRSWALFTGITTGHLTAYQSINGVSTATAIYETNVCDGLWHHVAAGFGTGSANPVVYVDGVEVTTARTGTAAGDLYPGPATLDVGRWNQSNTFALAGSVDDIRIFDTALPESEIKALAAIKPGSTSGVTLSVKPLIHYTCEDSTLSPIVKNIGSLGRVADAILTGASTGIKDQPGYYSFSNEVGYGSAFTTDGVDDYINTNVTLNNATEFTVWRRARHLSTSGFDLDGFFAGVPINSAVRIGRGNGNNTLYAEHTNAGSLYNPATLIDDGQPHTLALSAIAGGNYKVWYDGILQTEAAVNGAFIGILNTRPYLIGAANNAAITDFANCEYYEYLIASRVLTDRELEWLETEGKAGQAIDIEGDPSILVYYDFKNPNPKIVENLADLSNPGIINGGEWSSVDRDPENPKYDLVGRELHYKGPIPRSPVISSTIYTQAGGSACLHAPTKLSQPGSIAGSFWMKTDNTGTLRYFMSEYTTSGDQRSWGIWHNGDLLGMYLSTAGTVASVGTRQIGVTLSDDIPHHVAFSLSEDNLTLKMWVDGVLLYNGTGATGTLFRGTEVFQITGANKSTGTSSSNLIGEIWSACFWTGYELTNEDVYKLYTKNKVPTTGLVGHWPMASDPGSQGLVFDVSGNDNHLTEDVGGGWTLREDTVDYLAKNGYSIATWYDGTNDTYSRPKLVSGANRLCISCYVQLDAATASDFLVSESNTVGDQRSWGLYFSGAKKLIFFASEDGLAPTSATSLTSLQDGVLYHILVTYDAGTVTFEVNGVDDTDTSVTDTSAWSGATADFIIGGLAASNYYAGTISQLLIHKNPTEVWSTATKAAIRATGKPSEIQSIVSGLGGTAWYFPDGDGNEVFQNLIPLTENGAPEQQIIPAGAGLPVVYNKLAPGQSLDLSCGAPNAPFAVNLNATAVSDLTYVQGDNMEADIIFVNSQPNGDDKIQIFESALTGNEREALRDDVA